MSNFAKEAVDLFDEARLFLEQNALEMCSMWRTPIGWSPVEGRVSCFETYAKIGDIVFRVMVGAVGDYEEFFIAAARDFNEEGCRITFDGEFRVCEIKFWEKSGKGRNYVQTLAKMSKLSDFMNLGYVLKPVRR